MDPFAPPREIISGGRSYLEEAAAMDPFAPPKAPSPSLAPPDQIAPPGHRTSSRPDSEGMPPRAVPEVLEAASAAAADKSVETGAGGGGATGRVGSTNQRGEVLLGVELSPSWHSAPSARPSRPPPREAPEVFLSDTPSPHLPNSSERRASGFAEIGSVQSPQSLGQVTEPALQTEPMLRGVSALTYSGLLTTERSSERSPSGFPRYTLSSVSSAIPTSLPPSPEAATGPVLSPLPPLPPEPPSLLEDDLNADLAPASSESPIRGFRFVRGAAARAATGPDDKPPGTPSLERIL